MNGAYCLVSREYPPHAGGGIGTYATVFSRLLAARGIPVVVITAHAHARSEEELEGVHVIRLPLNADERWEAPHPSINSADMQRLWRQLGPHSVFSKQIADLIPKLLDRFGVSAIEGCDTGAPLWHLLDDRANAKWSTDVRIITHVHSPSAWIERLNRRLEPSRTMHELQRMEREQARASDTVVTPSHGMQRWLDAHWSVHADVIRYPFVLPPASPLGTGGALFVGRLEYRKGIDTLIQAWPSVDTDDTLRLVGSDVVDYRTNTPIGASLLKGIDRTEFLGPQPPERVKQLQAEASVIVVPSPDDNFPFTCVEAMAAGRIVVAANHGGASEMIEHGTSGLLFEPYDPAALAQSLTRACGMTDADRRVMGAAARERIADLCNADHVLSERLAHADREPTPVCLRPEHTPDAPLALRQQPASAPAPQPTWKTLAKRLLGR